MAVPHPTENVELLGGQFEGDMVLNQDQMNEINGIESRVGLIDGRYRWTNNLVPYTLGSEFSE